MAAPASLQRSLIAPPKKGNIGVSGQVRERDNPGAQVREPSTSPQHLQVQTQVGFGGGEASKSSGFRAMGKQLLPTTASITKVTRLEPSEKRGPQPPARGQPQETPSKIQGHAPSPAEPL